MRKFNNTNPINFLYVFIILNLIIGLFIVPDFGRSTDESHENHTSSLSLEIYTGKITENFEEEYEKLGHDRFYGTASSGIIQFIERFLFPEIDHSQKVVAHYYYFIFFQAAVLGVYLLAKHFLDEWSSLGAALLFGTQPLLFGHAFINPKDIPLLTGFLFTVLTGFWMVGKWIQSSPKTDEKPNEDTAQEASSKAQTRTTRFFIVIFLALFLVLWSIPWLENQILAMVEYGFTTKGDSLLGKLFAATTTYGSLEGYLGLTNQYLYQLKRWIIFTSPFLLLVLFYISGRKRLFGGRINLTMLLAAAVWGFAISTRILAIAAGGIVGLYALVKLKQKAVFPLVVYSITASIFSFVFWPFLWFYGPKGYLDSLKIFSDFPWSGQVLFEGQFFEPDNLPIRYLPKLMLLQFTEPLVILTLVGFVISLYLLYKKQLDTSKWLLLYAWFLIPLLFAMFSDSTIYNNFRHFLFTTPPIFIFAGTAFRQFASLIKQRTWIQIFYIACLIPGVFSIVQIHPYEYMYYNAFTGGIEGAYQFYELDYWNNGFKIAMDYVNENLPPGSDILVWKDDFFGRIYSEGDFTFTAHTAIAEEEYQNFDYAIMPTSRLDDLPTLNKYPVIHSVEIDNASLFLILEISQDDD